MCAVPSLESLCVLSASEGAFWKVQRRSLERLPEHAANELLALLLVRQPGEIRPATLELFRHCVTRLELLPPPPAGAAGQAVAAAYSFGPDWAAVLAGFSHLAELRVRGCSRLTVAALQALLLPAPATDKAHAAAAAATAATAATAVAQASSWRLPPPCRSPAAASLRRLDVSGCSRMNDEAAALIARCCGCASGDGNSRRNDDTVWGPQALGGALAVTGLVSLDISETAVTGTGLRHLTALAGLTELRAGGLKSCSDADWCALLPHLPALRRLDAWGTDAGDGGDGGEQLLAVAATAAAAADGSATRGGGGNGSGGGLGMHRLEHLSLAWTRVRVAPAFPALQVLDLRHCQLQDVWWPDGSGGVALPLRQLLLRGAVVSGRAAGAESGIAALIRHAAATLELLDMADVSAPSSATTTTAAAAAAGGGGAGWPLPLAALAGPHTDGGDGDGVERGGHDGGGARRLTHLDISRTAVPAEQLAQLQHAPALRKLVAAGCRVTGCARGAAALVAAGLGRLQELDLSCAGVTDECMAAGLQQLSSLTSLNLSGNPDLSLAPPPPPPPPAQEQGQQPQQQQRQVEEDPADAMAGVWRQREQQAAPGGVTAARGSSTGSSRRSSEDGEDGDGGGSGSSSSSGLVWPQLLRLNLLGTRVTEGGLRALLSMMTGSACRGRRQRGSSGGSGGDASESPGPCVLEQLKLGGGGCTDSAAAALAAARLPRLHSLLVRLASGGGGGGGLPALRRLELQACWVVSPQDAARMASCMAAAGPAAAGPVLVVMNGQVAAGAAAAAAPAGSTASASAAARFGAAVSASTSTAFAATQAARRSKAASWGGAAAGAAAAAAAAAADDLSAYDQRLRYSREELVLLLAAAPLAGGGAAGCSWPEELGEEPPPFTAL